MANLRTLPIVEDLGSEQIKQLIVSYNALLDFVGNIVDDLEGAANIGAVNVAMTARLLELETNTATVLKIGRQPGVPSRPRQAVTG